jgi:hypothetical protein
MRACFVRRGYAVTPDTPEALGTAPARFEFVTVWNLLNPDRIALSVTISRSVAGARRAAAWTTRENEKLGRGVVKAPVVRFGAIDVLWTDAPDRRDTTAIYGCVRPASRT